MLIGIKLTPVKSGPPQPSIFYCGQSGLELREKHAELLKDNADGSRFFQCHNPMMIPLPSVVENAEDHPDHVAAQKRRAAMVKPEEKGAAAAAPEIIQIPVSEGSPETEIQNSEAITPEARRAELAVLKHADLRGIAEGIKNSGRPIALITGTKAQLIEAIMASEIVTAGSEFPPSAETSPE